MELKVRYRICLFTLIVILFLTGCRDRESSRIASIESKPIFESILYEVKVNSYLNEQYAMADVTFIFQSVLQKTEYINIPVKFTNPLYYGEIYYLYFENDRYTLVRKPKDPKDQKENSEIWKLLIGD